MKLFALLSAALATTLLGGAALAGVPTQIDAQGVLRDATGDLVDLPDASLVFRIYDAAADGELLWSEAQDVPVVMGVFDTLLPDNPATELPSSVQARLAVGDGLWLSIQLEGQDELPRTALVSVPYAFTANRALIANDLQCSGCVDAAAIDTSAFTAQQLVYAPSGGLVTATTVAGALGELDGYLADHVANPDAHHPADSAGIAIKPSSVSVGTTTLSDGNLDLGPGADDSLSAAEVTTLTGGGNADALHKHTAASISGSIGGSCTTLYGSSVPSCPQGYAQAQSGYGLMGFTSVSGSPSFGGTGGVICADAPVTGGNTSYYSYWFAGSQYSAGYAGNMRCAVCCPASESSIDGCFQQTFASGAPTADLTGCVYTYEYQDYPLAGAPGREYHFKRAQMWAYGGSFSSTTANWDVRVTTVSNGQVVARVPAFPIRAASTGIYTCGQYAYRVPWLVQADLDLTISGTETLRFELIDAATNSNPFVAYSNSGAAGLVTGVNLSGCIAATP